MVIDGKLRQIDYGFWISSGQTSIFASIFRTSMDPSSSSFKGDRSGGTNGLRQDRIKSMARRIRIKFSHRVPILAISRF
jgi:hypothetical protein